MAQVPPPATAEPASEDELWLVAGDARARVVNADGCRLAELRVGDLDLLGGIGDGPFEHGCLPLVPWAGRLAEGVLLTAEGAHQMPRNAGRHAMHGLAWALPWQQVGRGCHGTRPPAACTRAAFTLALREPWPHTALVTQVLELAEDGLRITTMIEAIDGSFPAQIGWHPWFPRRLARGGELRLDLGAVWQEERGRDHLPTGRRIEPTAGPWDDCFGVPDGLDATLTWPGAIEVELTSSAGYVTVYDEPAEAIAVEPQTGPPNGTTTAPELVTPVTPLEASMRLAWRPLR